MLKLPYKFGELLSKSVINDREGNTMKKLSIKMKILLVAAVCSAMMMPVAALATEADVTLLNGQVYLSGYHTETLSLTGKTNRIEFEVKNGDSSGENMVSSVKISLLDEMDNVKEVIISPDQFNQREFSNALGTLIEDSVAGMTEIKIAIKVGGPNKIRNRAGQNNMKIKKVSSKKSKSTNATDEKECSISLYVKEYYESGSTRPNGW